MWALSILTPSVSTTHRGQTGGCTVAAKFVDDSTGVTTSWSSGVSFGARLGFRDLWTVDIGTGNNFPFNTADLYEIDIYLTRPQSAVGVCNPTALGVYMEDVLF
jgi:hypothetical protein